MGVHCSLYKCYGEGSRIREMEGEEEQRGKGSAEISTRVWVFKGYGNIAEFTEEKTLSI